MTTENVFKDDAIVENYMETLVGEGKKYKSTDELAKGYANADTALKARTEELVQLRAELNTRLTVEEQLKKIQVTKDAASNAPVDDPAKTRQDHDNALSKADLDARILEVMTTEQTKNKAIQNATSVTQRLIELFGDETKANEVVRQKAAELGVSAKFLLDVATQSPKAFYAQLGLDEKTQASNKQSTNAPFKGNVNVAALENTPGVKGGSYEFYENLRKTDPKNYFTPRIQNQLFRDAADGKYNPPGT